MRAHTHTHTPQVPCVQPWTRWTHTHRCCGSALHPTPQHHWDGWEPGWKRTQQRPWDGETGTTEGRGGLGRERRKGLLGPFRSLHWGPLQGQAWAALGRLPNTIPESPAAPGAQPGQLSTISGPGMCLHVEIRAVGGRRKLVFPECLEIHFKEWKGFKDILGVAQRGQRLSLFSKSQVEPLKA